MTVKRSLVLHATVGLALMGAASAIADKAPVLQWSTPDNASQTVQPQKLVPTFNTDVDLILEAFEAGMPESWFLNTNTGSPGWQVANAAGASSDLVTFPDHTSFAYCNSDAEGDGVTMDDYMITDLFDIPAETDCFLSYDYYFLAGSGSWYDFCDVLFSTGGGDWEILASLTEATVWTSTTLDLSEYAGSEMCQIAFRFWDEGTWAWAVGIDNVRIFTTVGDEFPPTISVAPYYNHMDINAGFDVMADIVDPSGIMSADFMYRMGPGDWTSIAMSPVAGDTWEAAVPGIGGLANLEWKISATDFSPNENMAETASMFTEVNNDAWLHYDLLGESTNGLGLATGAWQAATLFDPGVWPVTLTEVESGIFLNGGPTNITFNLIIYNSDGTDGAPGTVLHTQSVTTPNAEQGIWTLTTPLEVIDPFYVAISIAAGGYVYTDNVGYHFDNTSFLSTGTDWQTVEEINFQINWIIHVHAMYTTVDVAPEQVLVPNGIQLLQSWPNPFNPSTEIAFHLNHAQQVSVDVFNVQGEKVRTLANQAFEAGDHSLTFDASDLASGVYVAVLKSGAEQRSIKLTLVR